MNIFFSALYRWQKNGKTVVNPAPVDPDTPNVPWLSEQAVSLAPHFKSVGINGWVWPPLTMAQGRSANNSDGYGKQYDLNIGQWYPTRWGLASQVLSANEALHEAGLLVLEDAVIHQYDGGNKFSYLELGSNGKPDVTLFPKFSSCFVPTVPVDPVFDANGNMADGDMVSYVNSLPKGYMLRGVTEAMKFREDALGIDGRRIDEAKGEAVSTVKEFLKLGTYNFCEVFSGGSELDSYIAATGAVLLDFDFHFAAKRACEGGSFWNWHNAGLWARHPDKALLFADSADTDLNNGENIRWNKIWAYVVGLMMPASGMLIYAADYLPERYNLQKWIDNLCWISRTFAFGNLTYPYIDDTFIVFERDGNGGKVGWSGGLLVAINSDPINNRGMWVKTSIKPNTLLHNYSPTHGPDTTVNNDGYVYLEVGPNVNGTALSYACWAPAGVEYTIPQPALPHNIKVGLTDFSNITRYTPQEG